MGTGTDPVGVGQDMSFLAPWLDNSGVERRLQTLVRRALCDVGILEAPPGSNRGRRIDYYLQLCGVPMGSPYCAAALYGWCKWAGVDAPPVSSRWWRDSGLETGNPANVDSWITWAKATKRWSDKPAIGSAVVYGNAKDPGTHIGLVIRAPGEGQPHYRSFEANTMTSPGFSREGDGFEMKWLRDEQLKRVTGYIKLGPV